MKQIWLQYANPCLWSRLKHKKHWRNSRRKNQMPWGYEGKQRKLWMNWRPSVLESYGVCCHAGADSFWTFRSTFRISEFAKRPWTIVVCGMPFLCIGCIYRSLLSGLALGAELKLAHTWNSCSQIGNLSTCWNLKPTRSYMMTRLLVGKVSSLCFGKGKGQKSSERKAWGATQCYRNKKGSGESCGWSAGHLMLVSWVEASSHWGGVALQL